MIDLNDEREAQTVIEAVCPNPTARRTALSILAEAITEANLYGRDKWAVRVENTARLTVGHYYLCTILASGVWIALDDRGVNTNNYAVTLNMLKSWGWAPDEPGQPGAYPTYKDKSMRVDFSINGLYTIGANHQHDWPHIRRLFFNFIYKAIYHGQPMDPRSRELHSPGMLKYFRNYLGVYLPDPLY